MFKKSELEHNPFLIWTCVQRHWAQPPQSLEIELLDRKEKLRFVTPTDMTTKKRTHGICIGEGHCYHDLDAEGREFFSKLRPQFGKVWIPIPGEAKPREFLNYEEFLSEIAED